MSDTTVACARCRYAFTSPAPTSVCLPRDQRAEQLLLDDALLTALCPACGAKNDVEPRSLLFTDLVRRWYVVALPSARVVDAGRLEQVVEQAFQREFDQDHDVWDDPAKVKRRVVFGREALREKVVIWRRGLDDSIVESLKAAMFDTEAGRQHRLRGMRLAAIDDKNLLFRVPGTDALMDVDLTAYAVMHGLRSQLVEKWPALFQPGWVDALRVT